MTVKNFPYKDAKVLTPLGLSNYFTKHEFSNVEEMDWYNEIKINDIKITFLPAIHWSKRTLLDTNKTLWGSFLIEYKDIKLFFACDTGYGNIYKELGEKIGPIDISFINIYFTHLNAAKVFIKLKPQILTTFNLIFEKIDISNNKCKQRHC